MAQKRKKSISFDAMVRFFMRNYDIPTKTEIHKIISQLEHMEELILNLSENRTEKQTSLKGKGKTAGIRKGTAADEILAIIRNSKDGIGFSDIKEQSKFDEKKLRNIIFRLNSLGYITRLNRGVYVIKKG